MPDLSTVQVIVGIATALVAILGTVFGWFGAAWRWFRSLSNSAPPAGVIVVPKKTLILLKPQRHDAAWWHMGSSDDQPAMQIVGHLKATNITDYSIFVLGVKLKKPPAFGHVMVAGKSNVFSSDHGIPPSAIGDVSFDFWVMPPIYEKGKPFKSNVALIDQFGNEHWIKNLEFPYHG